MNSYELSRNFINFAFENPDKIKPNHCEECKYLKYESDTDSMVCTAKGGCVNPPNKED